MGYKVVDLFAGIGGMTKAFNEVGFQVIWANDFDKAACEIYKFNNSEVELVQVELKQINLATLPACDILSARFPVPSFSTIGYQKDYTIDCILSSVLAVIAYKQPKAFLLENVKTILTHDKGRTFKLIIEELEGHGYKVDFKILNAKDYGDIAHNKERLYIVGFKNEKDFENFSFPNPITLKKFFYEIVNVSDKKEDIYYINKSNKYYNFFNEKIKEKYVIYKSVNGKFDEFRKVDNKICPTISSRANFFILDDYGIRSLTVEEYLEFHGLYDYKLPDNFSKQKKYNLIASASIVPIVRRIAVNIRDVLDKTERSSNKQNIIEVNEYEIADKKVEGQLKFYIEENDVVTNLYTNDFESLLDIVENEKNIQEKGKALELLIKKFFEQIQGFEVSTNIRTKTEEIDIRIKNKSNKKPWIDERFIIIGECKNWSKSCGKNEFVLFQQKLENRNERVRLGFFISWNGFGRNFIYERLRNSRNKTLIVLIDGNQIKQAIKSGRIEDFLEDLYSQAILT